MGEDGSSCSSNPLTRGMEIGIIGFGDMGQLYGRVLAGAGFRVNACDTVENYAPLCQRFNNDAKGESETSGIYIYKDGHQVSRRSDYIFYSVETSNIDKVVSLYGPSSKMGAIIAGQTSVKAPEIAAFEKYIPSDCHIVTCHSLHGPRVDPKGQSLVVIRHRASDEIYNRALAVLRCFQSRNVVEMSYTEHDRITADTQVCTHVGFEAMGTAWMHMGVYPWEVRSYIGGIDNIKILMGLRLYSMKWHVYAGLALMNPYAKNQVRQYANSVAVLFKMMIAEDKEALYKRVKDAGKAVFGDANNNDGPPLLLPDEALEEFGLGSVPSSQRTPNSHLSLLAMVDCWCQLGLKPYDHLLCQTPLFRLRLGIAEFLFKNEEMLEETLQAALYLKDIRSHDVEFYAAVREWANIISYGDMEGYRQQFEKVSTYFESRLKDAQKTSDGLIKKLSALSKV
eukprot:Nk52_evm28s24 gene=Nk52_evmTU28s24